MWEAIAEYADGTSINRLFAYDDQKDENEQQYEIECWLLERHKDCVWFTVNYLFDDECCNAIY